MIDTMKEIEHLAQEENELPEWAEKKATGWTDIRSALATRDGRRTGNAVLVDRFMKTYQNRKTVMINKVVTDAGNIILLTDFELSGLFFKPKWVMKDFLPTHQEALNKEGL